MPPHRGTRWSLDAWLAETYARYGAGYLWRALACCALAVLALNSLAALAPALYLELSVPEYATLVLVAVALDGLAVAFVARRYWGRLRPAFEWSRRERRRELLSTADDWAFTAWRHAVATWAAFVVVLTSLGVVITILALSDRWGVIDVLEQSIGTASAGLFVVFSAYASVELILRPLRASLERTEIPEPRWPGMTTVLVPIIALLSFIAGAGMAYMPIDHESAGALLVAFAVASGPAVFGGLASAALLSTSLLIPLRELIAGHRAVAAGDLEARVVVTTSDDFGELAASFNGMVDELRRQAAELRAAQARIVASSDEARRQVERDLHDGAQQTLTLLTLKLTLLDRHVADEAGEAGALVREMRADLTQALGELRDLAHGIYPAALTTGGLPAALSDAAERSALPVHVGTDELRRYPPEIEAAVYFCCREALQNAAKHAGEGARVAISLAEGEGELRFEVADDGAGFNGPPSGHGVQNMADRIGALGGELEIDSRSGTGTTVRGRVPV